MSISAWLLDPATPHHAVRKLVSRRWRQVQNREYELCIALHRLSRDNVHRHEGFSRFVDFADQRFGIPEKLAALFCFLARNLARLPKTRAALERGDITYTKAREFVKLATVEDEETWIEYAMTHTNRDLERRCLRARRGTEQDEKKVVSRLTPAEVQTTRKAREVLMKDLGRPIPGEKILATLAKRFVDSPGLFSPSGAGGEDPGGRPAAGAGPYLTINLCPRCTHTHVPTPGENLRVPVEEWFEALKNGAEVHDLLADLFCECEGEKHRRDLCPHARSRSTGGEPPNSRHVPAEVWRRVVARDGNRCRRPGCGNPVPLEKSHLKPYRDGTPSLPENLAQHCATCNDLIETGRLRVEGEAPVERYYLADGTFVGFGFDPSPHVGISARSAGKGDADPPSLMSHAVC